MRTPKYLTRQVCEDAVTTGLNAVLGEGSPLQSLLSGKDCYVCIIVPGFAETNTGVHLKPVHTFTTGSNQTLETEIQELEAGRREATAAQDFERAANLRAQTDKLRKELPTSEENVEANFPILTDFKIRPILLYERSVGEEATWKYPYRRIALSKGVQLFTNRNNGEYEILPHLLYKRDTIYWGGTKKDGIVVSCSGFQPCFDCVVSKITLETLITLAHYHFEEEDSKKDFIE